MPSEFGGKKFASEFRSMVQGEIAKALDEGRGHIRQATSELKDAIKEQSLGAARVIREEAQHIRDTLGEFTGNNPPETEESPLKTDVPPAGGRPDPTSQAEPPEPPAAAEQPPQAWKPPQP